MPTAMTETEKPALLTKYYAADEVNFTPGERSFVAWISVEVVDHEGDVVLAAGIDYKSVYMTNPVVMAVHDYGKWPLGQCEWLKVKTTPQWAGLYGKAGIDDDPDAEVVWKKIKKRTVRGISIGFQPPDDMRKGEWGPPTPDELRRNPHWKGAKRVIRRCVMIEFSVCPIGMNPAALIEMVSKGLHKPVYASLEPPTVPDHQTEDVTDGSEGIDAGTESKAGRVDRPEVQEADPEPPATAPAPEAVTKAARPEPDDEPDDDEDDTPLRNGHFARVTKGPHKGVVGKVKSVHRNGLVPDVDDDVPATKADPAVRLNVYKAMGDGHKESSLHVGCKMAHCEKTADLKPPRARKELAPDPLPPIAGKTDDRVKAEQLARLRAELPKAFRAAEDRALGAV